MKPSEIKLSDRLYAFVSEREGLRLHAYCDKCGHEACTCDEPGVWTIGKGTTRIHGEPVQMGDTCTRDEAEAWLRADLESAANIVRNVVVVDLTEGQFFALVSFVYNVGPGVPKLRDGFVWLRSVGSDGKPRHSTMLTLLNAGEYTKAADEFPKWCHAAGRKSDGLLARRNAERRMFLETK